MWQPGSQGCYKHQSLEDVHIRPWKERVTTGLVIYKCSINIEIEHEKILRKSEHQFELVVTSIVIFLYAVFTFRKV